MVTTPIITFISDPNEPDLYNDVNGLPNPFTMNVLVGIANTNHTQTLYYKASLVSPPSGYSNYVQNLGSVAHDASAIFTFSFQRASPTLTAGELDELLTFRVDAYTDSGYSVAYANQSLAVTVHQFDHSDASWTIVSHDTFDGAGNDGWVGFNVNRTNVQFLTSPNSLICPYDQNSGLGWSAGKSFTVGSFTKARIVFHVYADNAYGQQNFEILVNGVAKKPQGLLWLPADQWLRAAFNSPVNSTFMVYVHNLSGNNNVYIDEIWVIAK